MSAEDNVFHALTLQRTVRILNRPGWSNPFRRIAWEFRRLLGLPEKPPQLTGLVQKVDWNLVASKEPIYTIHRPTAEEIAAEENWRMANAHLNHDILDKTYPLTDLWGDNPRGTPILRYMRTLDNGDELYEVDDIGFLSGWGGFVITRLINENRMVISQKCDVMS